jgi:4-hydroxybenzoate polyprenyltransferase
MRISGRLLPILQLTRMALVFTAIADSLCALFLQSRTESAPLNPLRIAAVILTSIGLYGLGMALNDIIDRRRDALIASHRPLPSGRIGVTAAHLIATFLTAMALAGAALYSSLSPSGWRSFVLVLFTTALITFYDFAGKYLVAPGLLTLGMIRFFHASIPAPSLPVLWHPLLLLNHVAILSAVAYRWEQKRPPLTAAHWSFVLGGLAGFNALLITTVYLRRADNGPFVEVMSLTPNLLLPGLVAVAFVFVATLIRRHAPTPKDAGQQLMLFGLLWLILYDASFCAAYSLRPQAILIASLLPIAYLSVRMMRWWSTLSAISRRPEFKRS